MIFGGGSLLIWYCVVGVVLAFLIVTFFCCWCVFVVSCGCGSRILAWFYFVDSCCCFCCWFSLSESDWLSLLVFLSFWVEYRFVVLFM